MRQWLLTLTIPLTSAASCWDLKQKEDREMKQKTAKLTKVVNIPQIMVQPTSEWVCLWSKFVYTKVYHVRCSRKQKKVKSLEAVPLSSEML